MSLVLGCRAFARRLRRGVRRCLKQLKRICCWCCWSPEDPETPPLPNLRRSSTELLDVPYPTVPVSVHGIRRRSLTPRRRRSRVLYILGPCDSPTPLSPRNSALTVAAPRVFLPYDGYLADIHIREDVMYRAISASEFGASLIIWNSPIRISVRFRIVGNVRVLVPHLEQFRPRRIALLPPTPPPPARLLRVRVAVWAICRMGWCLWNGRPAMFTALALCVIIDTPHGRLYYAAVHVTIFALHALPEG